MPFPTPEDLPDPGVELESLASPALASGNSLPLSHLGSPSLYLIGVKPFEMIKCPLPIRYTTNYLHTFNMCDVAVPRSSGWP